MNDSNKSILPKHLHAEIKSIENFHDVLVFHFKGNTRLDNTRLQLLKENTRLSHLPEYSSEIWNIILEYHDIHFTRRSTPTH